MVKKRNPVFVNDGIFMPFFKVGYNYALLSLFKYSFFKKGPFLVINRCRYM